MTPEEFQAKVDKYMLRIKEVLEETMHNRNWPDIVISEDDTKNFCVLAVALLLEQKDETPIGTAAKILSDFRVENPLTKENSK